MLSDPSDVHSDDLLKGLNPCSGGLCSLTYLIFFNLLNFKVLILVLVDYAL